MSCPTLDFADALVPALGPHGLDPERLDGDLAERFAGAHEEVQRRRTSGDMGFFRLPSDH